MKAAYLVLFLLAIGLLIYLSETRGVGHGAFEFPVEIRTEKEITESDYRLLTFLAEDSSALSTQHDWRELKEDDLGAFKVRVPYSSSVRDGWFRKRKVTYLHSSGINIRLQFSDGSTMVVTSAIQPHPRKNLIVIETKGSIKAE